LAAGLGPGADPLQRSRRCVVVGLPGPQRLAALHRRVCDFVGPSGSAVRCEGSLAVHLRGPPCSWVRCDSPSGLAGVATCAHGSSTGPEASRTSPPTVSCGKFPSQRDVAHGLPFAFPTMIRPSACAAARISSSCSVCPFGQPDLSWGCPKIAPPSGSPAESTPRSGLPCTEVHGFSGRSERCCPRARARSAHVPTSPFLRPRRFLPRQAAGVLHPAPIVGFGSFRDPSALASWSFPAPRSCPPKPCSPMRATPPAHARVAAVRHRVAVADRAFTEPLAPSLLVV